MKALAFVLYCLGRQSGGALADRALEEQDFYRAWTLIGAERDELTAWRGRARILYRAGDPAGAFSAALAGLATDPSQIELLYYAAGAAIWLDNSPDAVNYSERFLRAAEVMDDAEHRREWKKAAMEFSDESKALVEHEKRLSLSLFRLKALSLGVLASWFVVIRVLLGQGKSSKPVS